GFHAFLDHANILTINRKILPNFSSAIFLLTCFQNMIRYHSSHNLSLITIVLWKLLYHAIRHVWFHIQTTTQSLLNFSLIRLTKDIVMINRIILTAKNWTCANKK